MPRLNSLCMIGFMSAYWAFPVYSQNASVESSTPLSGRRPVPNQSSSATVLPTHSSIPAAAAGSVSASTGSRPKTSYSVPIANMRTTDRAGSIGHVASSKTNWLPPLPVHTQLAPAINPSLPRYDTRVANNQRFKPTADGGSAVVQSSFYAPQPPAIPSFPGGTFPPGSTAPPPTSSAQPGTFPPTGGLPTFGGSGSSFSDSSSSGPPGVSSPPQPLIPGGSVGGGTSTLPSAPPTSGIRSATPPAASYPMPGIAGQGNAGSSGMVNPSATRPLGSVPTGGGTMPGATPLTNMANPNYGMSGGTVAPSSTPRYATGEPFVTGPPRQVEMPYMHASVANNSCLPGWFSKSSTPVATTPTAAMNNTTSGVYPANTYPTNPNTANPNTANPNTYPGVPGYIVPPTVTQNMAPQMFSPNNNGYTPLVNWGTESNNVTVGRGMFGGPTVYVNDEPVRNFFRYVFH